MEAASELSRIDRLLADYASYHRTRGNITCHFFGIPLIIFGIFLMLGSVRIASAGPFPVTAAEVLIASALLYYITLDLKLAACMLAVSIAFDAAARSTGDYRWGIAAFVIGWVFQGIGHIVFEKKSPAFQRNLVHLLIGPLFLVNEALHLRPLKGLNSQS